MVRFVASDRHRKTLRFARFRLFLWTFYALFFFMIIKYGLEKSNSGSSTSRSSSPVPRRSRSSRLANKATPSSSSPPSTTALPPGRHPPWIPGTSTKIVICDDSCPEANNDVCNDGRTTKQKASSTNATPTSSSLSPIFPVTCDLGTDCSDCGEWSFQGPPHWAKERPIQEIIAKNFTVNTAMVTFPHHTPLSSSRTSITTNSTTSSISTTTTSHILPFYLAFTDPNLDVDVSHHMFFQRIHEKDLAKIWYQIMQHGSCIITSPPPHGGDGNQYEATRVVLDVGANFGIYSLMSAAMGCRVVAWEPVPYFAAFFKYGMIRSQLVHLIELREAIVGETDGEELTIIVPNRGIWGTAGVGGMNIDPAVPNDGGYDHITRKAERLDTAVMADENVLILKVDVEGYEPYVMRSGGDWLLKQCRVENIIMEYSPGVAERNGNWDLHRAHGEMLLSLLSDSSSNNKSKSKSSGGEERGDDNQEEDDEGEGGGSYQIGHVGWGLDSGDWDEPLPLMKQVSAASLQYDIQDSKRLNNGVLGCPMPSEVMEVAGRGKAVMFGCQSLPEGLDPRSFRASFGYNTNIWATLKTKENEKREDEYGASNLTNRSRSGMELMRLNDTAALFPDGYDVKENYFSPRDYGSGGRGCMSLDAVVQVMHRCRCREEEVCGELERVVMKMAGPGKMPPKNVG